jgi:hypothetical protein
VVLQVAEKEDPGWTGVKTDFHFRATSPIWRITQKLPQKRNEKPRSQDRGLKLSTS